jgi:hypothetical protein
MPPRLYLAEKRALDDAARSSGFCGISEYLRIRGLALG